MNQRTLLGTTVTIAIIAIFFASVASRNSPKMVRGGNSLAFFLFLVPVAIVGVLFYKAIKKKGY